MAFVGRPADQCVTTDHIGVPHGGMYGNVRHWEPVLKRHGLRLAYSLIWHSFLIYTIDTEHPQHPLVCQMHLRHKDGGPIPLDRRVVETMRFLRESYHRSDQTLLKQHFETRKQAKKDKREEEVREESQQTAREAVDRAWLAMGLAGPKVTVDMGATR